MTLPSPLPRAAPATATARLRAGLALGLADVAAGRPELREAATLFADRRDARGELLAWCALVLFIAIADDDYSGFEAGTAAINAAPESAFAHWADPADALLAEAGRLVAATFEALDSPRAAGHATAIHAALSDPAIPAAVRCCAGLAALGYHHISMDPGGVLWLELAMRPLRADPALGARLADEALHLFVQSLYQCEEPERAAALRDRRAAAGPPPLPVIELKLHLLDAQMAIGAGQADAGRASLQRAEPLLEPGAPRLAGWWHLLHSRLDLLGGRHAQALTHARLALRLSGASGLPERWMGVAVMQEGHIHVSQGAPLAAVPFFERAGRASTGPQARLLLVSCPSCARAPPRRRDRCRISRGHAHRAGCRPGARPRARLGELLSRGGGRRQRRVRARARTRHRDRLRARRDRAAGPGRRPA